MANLKQNNMGLSKSQSKVAKSQPAKKPEVATPKKGAATKKESATPKREVAAPKKAKKAEKPSVPKGPHWENDVWLGNQGKKWTADQVSSLHLTQYAVADTDVGGEGVDRP